MSKLLQILLVGVRYGSLGQAATHNRPLVSTDLCTGLINSGKVSSLANKVTLQPFGTVKCLMVSSPLKYGLMSGLLDWSVRTGGKFESSTLRSPPLATAQTR